jgi:hypothetical protein
MRMDQVIGGKQVPHGLGAGVVGAQAGSWCSSWFLALAADRDGPAM